ncbi:MAG TPA: DUF3455 domain-containing protein [Nitrospirota bacterium]|nr:DUF3455 domain-containing protein [Nitrospirota bacterium]
MKRQDVIAMTGMVLVALVAGSALTWAETSPLVPENLRPPATEVLSLGTKAIGVQIYECNVSKDEPTRFEWTFKAPEADIFDMAGNKIAKHYAGPTWESNDGSKVVGEVKAKDNGPDPDAIPWLLMSAKSTSGTGVFSQVKSIQRVHTVGGRAPTEACSQAQAGKVARVGYKATYNFYVAKP